MTDGPQHGPQPGPHHGPAGTGARPVLTWVSQVPSTQAELVARARAGQPDQAMATTWQTHGHGRRGRDWQCPPGGGLALSVLLHPSRDDGWTWIPLLTGVAVAETLDAIGVGQAWLKWPNDVMVERSKLAGLLADRVEPGPRQADRPAAVVGIGLNLRSDGLPDGACAVEDHTGSSTRPDPADLAERLLGALLAWLERWESRDEAVAQAYRRRCATIGAAVRLTEPGGRSVDGTAVGVDDDGRIVLDLGPSGRLAFSAGDVEHLRLR